MALTQLQAQDKFVIDSIAHFINRRVKVAYDAGAVTNNNPNDLWKSPLKVMMGRPDDPAVTAKPPVVAIDTLESTERDRFYEIGSPVLWRHMSLVFYCYPALNSQGQPSLNAALFLRSCMKNALGIENIKMVDFSNPGRTPTNEIYTSDVIEVVRVTDPMPRGEKTANAVERHRFDQHLSIRYPVTELVTDS